MDNTQNQQPKLEIPAEVREFLEGILKDANMSSLDDSMHEEMINELFARLDSYMTSIMVDAMPPENLDEFIKMNEEKKSQAEVETYIKGKIPNAQEVLTKAFMNFRDMYLRNVTVARNAPASNAASPNQSSEANDQGGNN